VRASIMLISPLLPLGDMAEEKDAEGQEVEATG
jgi:hypothetical protein